MRFSDSQWIVTTPTFPGSDSEARTDASLSINQGLTLFQASCGQYRVKVHFPPLGQTGKIFGFPQENNVLRYTLFS